MRFKKLVFGGMAIAASLSLVSPAAADPKRGDSFVLHCPAPVGDVTVSTPPGNGTWTPALVAGTNMVLTPYELHISGSFTPTGGSPETFSEDSVKKAPNNGRLAVCTFTQTFTDDYGTGTFGGTAKVSYTKGK